eukprot:3816639-Pleurochrysis_carterae.AAC.1
MAAQKAPREHAFSPHSRRNAASEYVGLPATSTTSPFRKSLTLAPVSVGRLPATGGGVTGVGAANVGAELPPVLGVPCPAPTTRR